MPAAPIPAATSAASPADFDAIAYINTPRWQQVDLGLERIEELLERLGRPQDNLRFVHVAGTNGKGSTCAYIASVLQTAGYRTGLFTSPYIERFEERIRVDGRDIPHDDLTEITLAVRDAAEAMDEHPTEFELMCAVAMMHFARSACDIVVLEVGLGGRWDATNVIAAPEVCVICRLGLDHVALLGNTLPKIANEKAGIVKPGSPVVSWPQEPEALEVIERVCTENDSTLTVCDFAQLSLEPLSIEEFTENNLPARTSELPMRTFTYRGHTFRTRLLGSYQPGNAALALDAIESLRSHGWNISQHDIDEGIAAATWAGRFEVCATEPLFIVDGGHNQQGARVMAETLSELLPHTRPVFLIGILGDKDYPGMLREVVPHGSAFVCVTPDNPRALPAAELAEHINALACTMNDVAGDEVPLVVTVNDFAEGVVHAREIAGPRGAVCAFGSLYSIAGIKTALRNALADELPH